MPIYAYKCGSCGHAKDVLQKISDAPLSVCPACGAEAFSKQVTAAGFQLKGSGWYVTDFRGGDGKKSGADSGGDAPAGESSKDSGKADTAAAPAPAAAGAAPAASPAPAAAPAAGTASGSASSSSAS